MNEFLRLCEDCQEAQLKHASQHEGGNAPDLCQACAQAFKRAPRPCFSAGMIPDSVIKLAARSQCPDGYPMLLRSQDDWTALSNAWNQGIDSHLEALTERSSADSNTGRVSVHPEELHVLLRRLWDDGSDDAWELRGAIVYCLGIEEI